MVREFLTIAELAERADIPNSTCRRYLGTFEVFFLVKGGNRVKKYESQAVDILKRIKQLYDEGQDTNEIHNVLKKDFPLVINGDEQQEEDEETSMVSTLATSEDIVEIKRILEQQTQFNQMLLQKLEEQNNYIKESLERRDRQLLEALRESQQARIEAAPAEQKKPGFFARLFGKY